MVYFYDHVNIEKENGYHFDWTRQEISYPSNPKS